MKRRRPTAVLEDSSVRRLDRFGTTTPAAAPAAGSVPGTAAEAAHTTTAGGGSSSRPDAKLNVGAAQAAIDALYESSTLTSLSDRIDALSSSTAAADPDRASRAVADRSIAVLADWVRRQPLLGLSVEALGSDSRVTPALWVEIAATAAADLGGVGASGTVLIYSHVEHRAGPPSQTDNDGSSDARCLATTWQRSQEDGFSLFSTLAALAALQAQGVAHGRVALLLEFSSSSGSSSGSSSSSSSSSSSGGGGGGGDSDSVTAAAAVASGASQLADETLRARIGAHCVLSTRAQRNHAHIMHRITYIKRFRFR